MTKNPPVLPKSAMAIVGTTDKVAAHGTAHDIAMASTRCPQLSTTRVPVVPDKLHFFSGRRENAALNYRLVIKTSFNY